MDEIDVGLVAEMLPQSSVVVSYDTLHDVKHPCHVGAGEEDVDAASAPPRRARRRSAMLDAAARRRGVMRCDEASLDFVFCWS